MPVHLALGAVALRALLSGTCKLVVLAELPCSIMACFEPCLGSGLSMGMCFVEQKQVGLGHERWKTHVNPSAGVALQNVAAVATVNAKLIVMITHHFSPGSTGKLAFNACHYA